MHGGQKEKYLTEIQAPLLLPEWMGHLEEGIKQLKGEEAARYVVGDGYRMPHAVGAKERAYWVQGMLGRFEETVQEETQRDAVLAGCSHVFPERRVQQLRALYLESGNLDEVIAFMNEDRSEKGANYYESPRREGNTIRLTKIPFNAQGYQAAQTSLEKKLSYCHCPMVKDALREGVRLSPTYCYCGAGWYHTLWEGILERKVQVDVIRSLLNGDDACEFAIHLV